MTDSTPGAIDPHASIEVVDTPCPHCGGEEEDARYVGVEHEYRTTTTRPFPVVRCRTCRLSRLNPRPAVSELRRIYPPEYYAYHLTDGAAEVSGVGQRLKRRMYQRRLGAQLDRLGRPGPVRLLDVGCADGRLLTWWKSSRHGDRLETHGIEMSADAAERARTAGHHVITGRFETDTELEAGTYDLIIAAHVIEHVDDPVAFARRAAELLAPGGLFVVPTPNIDSWDARRFGRWWGGNHFPRHWTFYDPASITELAQRVGLECERVDYEANPVFWTWTIHSWARGRFPESSWPDRLFPPVGIFQPSLQSFVLLSVFTTIDLVQKLLTGRTASMSAELRRPVGSPPGDSRADGE